MHSHLEAQEVTGLTVNRKSGPSVSQKKQSDIRAAICQLNPANQDYLRKKQSVLGRIAYVRQTNPKAAKRLGAYLDQRLDMIKQNMETNLQRSL